MGIFISRSRLWWSSSFSLVTCGVCVSLLFWIFECLCKSATQPKTPPLFQKRKKRVRVHWSTRARLFFFSFFFYRSCKNNGRMYATYSARNNEFFHFSYSTTYTHRCAFDSSLDGWIAKDTRDKENREEEEDKKEERGSLFFRFLEENASLGGGEERTQVCCPSVCATWRNGLGFFFFFFPTQTFCFCYHSVRFCLFFLLLFSFFIPTRISMMPSAHDADIKGRHFAGKEPQFFFSTCVLPYSRVLNARPHPKNFVLGCRDWAWLAKSTQMLTFIFRFTECADHLVA